MKDFKSIMRDGAELYGRMSDWMRKRSKSAKAARTHKHKRKKLCCSVCQDSSAIIYGMYRGYLVQFSPKYHEVYTDCIGEWVPSPSSIESVEKLIANGHALQSEFVGAGVGLRSKYLAVTAGGKVVAVPGIGEDDTRRLCLRCSWKDNSWVFYDSVKYKGTSILQRPVVGSNGRDLVDLVPDPVQVSLFDRLAEGKNAADREVESFVSAHSAAQSRSSVGRVIVDGSNVIFADSSKLVVGLKTCVDAITSKGSGCFVFLDANIFHKLDETGNGATHVTMLKEMIDKANGTIALVPAGARADDFILKKADTEGCHVLSNDRYQPYLERYPWIDQGRVHRFSFVEGRLMIPDLDVDVSI